MNITIKKGARFEFQGDQIEITTNDIRNQRVGITREGAEEEIYPRAVIQEMLKQVNGAADAAQAPEQNSSAPPPSNTAGALAQEQQAPPAAQPKTNSASPATDPDPAYIVGPGAASPRAGMPASQKRPAPAPPKPIIALEECKTFRMQDGKIATVNDRDEHYLYYTVAGQQPQYMELAWFNYLAKNKLIELLS